MMYLFNKGARFGTSEASVAHRSHEETRIFRPTSTDAGQQNR